MNVTLISYTPQPERTVAMAARLCYSPTGAAELAANMSEHQVDSLIEKITSLDHLSTIEHVSFTFAIEGVSRVLTHQLVRHRIASYSQQSQRYVKEHDFEYIIPPTVAANATATERFEKLMATIRDTYNELVELGVHQEDARYVLANATETKIVVTMNARSLLHFLQLRCCNRAQWEIRQMANLMREEVRKVAPRLFKRSGPTCETDDYCSEGAMSCGRLEQLRRQDPVC